MSDTYKENAIEYIKSNIDLIDNNAFEDFYSKMNDNLGLMSRSAVTSLLLESGINPLIYMSRVPEYYLYGQKDVNPFMKSIIIPNSVKIPNSVTNIEGVAFANCKSLTSIDIPESVVVIGNWAFKDCTSLEIINYKGSKAQWGEIYKRSGWNKGVPAKAIHCIDGDVELSKSKS